MLGTGNRPDPTPGSQLVSKCRLLGARPFSSSLCTFNSASLPYSMIFTTKGLCLKNHCLLKKIPKNGFFGGRKLERDPKSSEVTARQALWVSLSHSLPEQTWATHRDHGHQSSCLFLPPKASITHRSSSGACARAAIKPPPGFNDRAQPTDSLLSASRLPPWSPPGTGSSRLPDASHQFTPDPLAAGSVPAQRFTCFPFRYHLLPALLLQRMLLQLRLPTRQG